MIAGKKVSFSHKKSAPFVLKDLSFELRKGRITTFMGPSGAGKTTLLKCIANLYGQYEGCITYKGKEVKKLPSSERASSIGFVLQQFHLFPHLTVLENCTFPLVKSMGLKEADAKIRSIEILDLLGMEYYLNSLPSQLSGGQQQRAAIARALVLRPEILLLDEPTAALDPDSKKSLEHLLLDLNSKGITIGLSSHDMSFIRKMMDYIYFMEQGQLVEEWDSKVEELSSKQKIKQFLMPL